MICWFFQGRVCVGFGRREREHRSEAKRSEAERSGAKPEPNQRNKLKWRENGVGLGRGDDRGEKYV